MNEPQLSAEIEKLGIINEDGSITFAYNELATALEEQATRHAMLMAGLEAQIEQKAVIRASELVEEARKGEREKVLSEVAIKIKTYFGYLSNDGVTGKPMDIPLSLMEFDILSFLSEVKPAKLNQLKGSDGQSVSSKNRWIGEFAPNGGHDPNNPFPLKKGTE